MLYSLLAKVAIGILHPEGSGLGSSERDNQRFCPTEKVLSDLTIKGSTAYRADNDVVNWLRKLGLMLLNKGMVSVAKEGWLL